MLNTAEQRPSRLKLAFEKFGRKPLGEKITYIIFFIYFFLTACVLLYPLIWAFFNSFKTAEDFFESSFALPREWVFENYLTVFTSFNYRGFTFLDMLWNSLWITVVRIGVNVMSSVLLAYAVAKFRFPGKSLLYGLVIFTQTVPIVGSGTATYKLLSTLGFVNNPALIWICWAVGFDFAFIVFYGAFKGVSDFYSESAQIDGANNFIVLVRVVLPQVFPVLIAIAVTQALTVWNDYTFVMIYLRDYPNLSYGLYLFDKEAGYVANSRPVFFGAVCLSVIPVFVIYACNLKLVLQNVTTGGLKG